jgi:hypothetical protein
VSSNCNLSKTIQLTIDVDYPAAAGVTTYGDGALQITRRDGPRSNDLLVRYFIRPSDTDIPGNSTWVYILQLSRWWCVNDLTISWVPKGYLDQGLVHLAFVRAEEAERVLTAEMIESYPSSAVTQVSERATLTPSRTCFERWEIGMGIKDGVRDALSSYTLEEWQAKKNTSVVSLGAVVFLIHGPDQIFKNQSSFPIGQMIIRFEHRGWEPEFPRTLDVPLKALLPHDNGNDGSDTAGGVRSLMALESRDEVVEDTVTFRRKYLSRKYRAFRIKTPMFVDAINLVTPTSVAGFLDGIVAFGMKAVDIVSGLFSSQKGQSVISGYGKVLELEGNDPYGLTAIEQGKVSYAHKTLHDSTGRLLSEQAVQVTFADDYQALVYQRAGASCVGGDVDVSPNHSRPRIGFALSAYVPFPVLEKNDDVTDSFAIGLSPNFGVYGYTGGTVSTTSNQVLPGTLLRYRQLGLPASQSPGEFNLSTILGTVSGVVDGISKVASAVVSIFDEDQKHSGVTLQAYGLGILPEGELNSVNIGVDAQLPSDYFALHWPHYDERQKAVFGKFYGSSKAPTLQDAAVSIKFAGVAHFNGLVGFYGEAPWTVENKLGKISSTTGIPKVSGTLICPHTGQNLDATLTLSIYPVHSPSAKQFVVNPVYDTPCQTVGENTVTVTQPTPIIQLLGTSLITGDGEKMEAFAVISLDLPFNLSKTFQYPKSYVDSAGKTVQYQAGEAINFGMVLVAELDVQYENSFSEVKAPQGNRPTWWRPAKVLFTVDHPADIEIAGNVGKVTLSDPGRGVYPSYPSVSLTRNALVNGKVLGDGSNPTGGVEFSDLSMSISNILPSDNGSRP